MKSNSPDWIPFNASFTISFAQTKLHILGAYSEAVFIQFNEAIVETWSISLNSAKINYSLILVFGFDKSMCCYCYL